MVLSMIRFIGLLFEPINWVLSLLASVLRLGAGGAGKPAVEPAQPLIVYEFEGCPYCRVAREAISETGVPVLMRPCPKGGKRFRPRVSELGGKEQFPYFIDPNANISMYESTDIARYLYKTYGKRWSSTMLLLGPINGMLSQFGVLARLIRGTIVRRSLSPDQPLEFVGMERGPLARTIKELLCEMEIEYYWRSRSGDGSSAPKLMDPNTGRSISGAFKIRSYLLKTYGG